jgi:hypothetical protein
LFTPEVADSMGLAPDEAWWGKTEEITCTGSMFGDPDVMSVAFGCELLDEWAPHQEVREDTAYAGLFRRLRPVIELTVAMEGAEDPLLKYVVNQSWLDVVVVPDRFAEGLWRVLSIEELRIPYLRDHPLPLGAATESCSWGGIKSMWWAEG